MTDLLISHNVFSWKPQLKSITMLDIAPSTENRSRSMMSLDLSPYLLSASPPISDFSLHSLSLTSSFSPYSFFSTPSSRSPPVCPKVYGSSYNPPLKSIMSISSREDSICTNESSDSQERASSSSNDSHKFRKKVSFADDLGMPLAEVRLMLDDPTSAPLLSFMNSFHSGPPIIQGLDDDAPPPLLAPHPQPLERENFEEDLRRNMVAVENVLVQGYEVTCTVFINVRPSSKRVFGRCTLDSWQTFQDVVAFYSQSRRPWYDTYQFSLKIPPSADRSMSIQIAVCYEADGVQHWDNNEGRNYTVHWNPLANPEGETPSYSADTVTDRLDHDEQVNTSNSTDDPYY